MTRLRPSPSLSSATDSGSGVSNSIPPRFGSAVELNGAMYTIAGVAAAEFFGERVEAAQDFWLPLSRQPQVMQRESLLTQTDAYWLNLMGRLKPGVTLQRAEASL